MNSTFKMAAVLLAFVLLVTVLAACGNAAGNPGGSSPSQSTLPAASDKEDCREIEHPEGKTCVPNQPSRTLVLLSDYADYMLAIGETPYAVVVTPQYDNKPLPYLEDKMSDVQLLPGGTDALNLEAVMSLQPDLILADNYTADKVYDSLSKIAPTVVLGELSDDPAIERWETDLQKVAEVFGKPEAANQARETLDRAIAEAKESIAALEARRIAFIRVRDKELQLYGTEGHALSTLLYAKLGLEPAALTEQQRIDLSQEKIPDLGAEYLFLQTDGADGDKNWNETSASALWNNVEAVKNDRVFKTDYWLYLSWGVLGQQEIIRQLLADLGLE